MKRIINETMVIAHQHFKKFGFENEQIGPLLESGKRDLTKELIKLQNLLEEETIDIDKINLSTHALKGLFLTMGNVAVADKLNEIRNDSETTHMITEIKVLLDL